MKIFYLTDLPEGPNCCAFQQIKGKMGKALTRKRDKIFQVWNTLKSFNLKKNLFETATLGAEKGYHGVN